MPILKTDEPVCPEKQLSCGNGECIAKELFCNNKPDCKDESDENACSKLLNRRHKYARDRGYNYFFVLAVELDPNRAPDCDTSQCELPECYCSADGTRIPGNIELNQVRIVSARIDFK